MPSTVTKTPEIIKKNEQEMLEDWVKQQKKVLQNRIDHLSESTLKQQCKEFLNQFQTAVQSGEMKDIDQSKAWDGVRRFLAELSRSRALASFSPSETALFVFSLKQPLFTLMQREFKGEELANEIWTISELLDKLGLFTTEVYQQSREDVIRRQQQELLELSTPVMRMWEGVIAVPIIGTLDSARTQAIMENLLQEIVDTNAKLAILDISGVPTVDTQTAQHLIKTVSAAKLMGTQCIISGIRPQIAQTVVHLGIELDNVITKATMYDALAFALARRGWHVQRVNGASSSVEKLARQTSNMSGNLP
ncbi:MAG: STAS domain-containing protein [Cyanobacteria bacterium TGS_CYA1]|nr:STAS domain-containing protein [Cyanobacteria bacterium TGS_CYA1]